MAKLKLSKKQKRKAIKIAVSFSLFIVLFISQRILPLETIINRPIARFLPCVIWFALYIYIGHDVIVKAIRNILHGQIFDENFLMLIATLGAFALGIVNTVNHSLLEGFDEAVAVLIFYQLGQLFEQIATEQSRKSISDLLDIRPDYANVVNEKGEVQRATPEEATVGDEIVIYPGEKIPLDCIINKGFTNIDNQALTGESMPVEKGEGDELLSGGINLTSQITAYVTKEFYNSTVCKILDLVENASDKKSKAENFTAKFAKYYTPCVIFFALLTAIIPSVITKEWQTWIYRALSFLVVSCPCALVISVPMTFFVALGKASKKRILIKGSDYLERLASANVFAFDKTGTITKGKFEVTGVYPEENKDNILKLCAIAEANSSHPIAKSILEEYKGDIPPGYTLTNLSGFGVMATNEEESILCGNKKLFIKEKIDFPKDVKGSVLVALNGKFLGSISLSDSIKSEVNGVIGALLKDNCTPIMLTGDSEEIAKQVCEKCNIKKYKANLLPQNKVEEIEKLIATKGKNDVVCFIGDGINDAPVLMRSDIGIAMGKVGSDAAIESADIVLMRDNLSDLLLAKQLAKKAMKIVKQNVIFSIAVKIAILILSLFGITNMWVSIFGDVGVAVVAILNALRVGK